jgi:hypothetical protein
MVVLVVLVEGVMAKVVKVGQPLLVFNIPMQLPVIRMENAI